MNEREIRAEIERDGLAAIAEGQFETAIRQAERAAAQKAEREQLAWEQSVRDELASRRFTPEAIIEIESAAGGFGQDWAEYRQVAVTEYVEGLLDDLGEAEYDEISARLDGDVEIDPEG